MSSKSKIITTNTSKCRHWFPGALPPHSTLLTALEAWGRQVPADPTLWEPRSLQKRPTFSRWQISWLMGSYVLISVSGSRLSSRFDRFCPLYILPVIMLLNIGRKGVRLESQDSTLTVTSLPTGLTADMAARSSPPCGHCHPSRAGWVHGAADRALSRAIPKERGEAVE